MKIMAKKRFNIIPSITAEDDTDLALKEYYSSWRKTNSENNSSFIALYSSFKEKHLADLEAGPLRLYLYFCFAANNSYGHSWHSIQKIADFFGTQTRTIDNWIKVLVEKNLIYREQKGKKSHTTYLIPYSNTLVKQKLPKKIKEDNQQVLDSLIKVIQQRKFLYGDIIKVFHIFQWGKNKSEKPVKSKNEQLLFIITKREDGILTGHQYFLKNSGHLGINTLEVGDAAIFKSPFLFNNEHVTGLALPHSIRFKDSNTDAILDLLEKLAYAEDWQLSEHPEVEYGEISDLLQDEELSDEELSSDGHEE